MLDSPVSQTGFRMTGPSVEMGRQRNYRDTSKHSVRRAERSALTITAENLLDLLPLPPPMISLRISPQLVLRLDERCKRSGFKRSAYLRVLIEGSLDEMDRLDQIPRREAETQ